PGVRMDVIEQAIDASLKQYAMTAPNSVDMDRAKAQLVAGAVYQRDNQLDLASAYGQALAIGLTVDDVRQWPNRIRAVTGAQIREAAERDVIKREAVTGFLLPGKAPCDARVALLPIAQSSALDHHSACFDKLSMRKFFLPSSTMRIKFSSA